MTEKGDVHDLVCVFNMNVEVIKAHPSYRTFRSYVESGGIAYDPSVPDEFITGSDGQPVFREIGVSNPIPGQQGRSEPKSITQVTRYGHACGQRLGVGSLLGPRPWGSPARYTRQPCMNFILACSRLHAPVSASCKEAHSARIHDFHIPLSAEFACSL